MARHARRRSSTGIYHIMLRGIDKRLLFMDDSDKQKFIKGMEKAKELACFKLYGYCLMDNHIHLLIEESEDIGTIIKRITVGYVQWHNNKYERIGHLFSNRYLSEPVESEKYLLSVLRYIHQNPVKAMLVKQVEDYTWSSYKHYLKAYDNTEILIDSDLILDYFKTQESFIVFMNELNDDEFIDYKTIVKYNDIQLRNWIEERYNIELLLKKPAVLRSKDIAEILNETGASVRQLSRILGLGKTTIGKVMLGDKRNVPLSR